MEAPGRPTPQSPASERPRFRDRDASELRRPDVNPYVATHRAASRLLLPASEAWTWRGRWAELFGREAPLHLEIGSGAGFFLTGMARAHPEWNFLGVELRFKRVVLCARKLDVAGVTNARIARYHAAFLDDLCEDGTVDAIYVNHPDPWPKDRHEKNRLIARWFLEDCARLLRPGGALRIKSDHPPNVARIPEILASNPDLPFTITGRSDDVVRDGAPWPGDVETNYQRKKRIAGIPVLAMALSRSARRSP
jgi:tRNA (guanine-N7-)-methyltransferase